ncbi:phosphoribosylpyrophosphate synthetase [Hymenobacter caeli]
MTTLTTILAQLKEEGYTEDFNLQDRHLAGQGPAIRLAPHEFAVDKYYRFEGNSDPDDEAVVYAISSAKFNLKGTLVNGYGIYSDAASDALVQALKEKTAAC